MKSKNWILIATLIFGTHLHAMDFLPFGGTQSDIQRVEPRCYEAGINQEQFDDLRYALTALAYNSFTAILADRVQLQEALMRVDEVHPLHFISAVFMDQELTNCLHAIRNKQWLWRHFFLRVKRTLDEEGIQDNLRPEYVREFSTQLNLSFEPTMEIMLARKWDELVTQLLREFPRVGGQL